MTQYVDPLHPSNKVEYNEGDRVDIALNGDITKLYTGTIRGKSMEHIIDHWIVELDTPNDLNLLYSCYTFQNTFLRYCGSNEPFLCEGYNRFK